MRKALGFISVAFKTNNVYRAKIYLSLTSSFMFLLVQYFFWKALYTPSENHHLITFESMVTYLVLARCVSILFLDLGYMHAIREDIRSGDIINHLTRPYNYMFRYMSEVLGRYLSSLLFVIVPMFLLCVLLFNFTPPKSVESLLAGILFLGLSFIIYFLINFIIGLSIFWIQDSNGLIPIIAWSIYEVASGSLIPLWYFPEAAKIILNFLPFKFSVDVPIKIYLGQLSAGQISYNVLHAFLWIVVLYALQSFIWKKALQKLNIQGG